MNMTEIRELLDAAVYAGDVETPITIEKAFASDLMSDVLTLLTDHLLLITGLNNIQTIRTAEMADISLILLVRGKVPNEQMIKLAKEQQIGILSSRYSMYKTSGILYAAGVEAVY